jgi:hypothetical protein
MRTKFKLGKAPPSKFFFTSVPFLISPLLIHGPGLSEGGQGGMASSQDKTNWWGAILPFVTVNDEVLNQFIISGLSFIIFWTGFYLFFHSYQHHNIEVLMLYILGICGAVFSIQNIRDSLQFSFAVLALGLIEKYNITKSMLVKVSIFLLLVLSSSFKYPTAIGIILIIVFRLMVGNPRVIKKKILSSFMLIILIVTVGVSFDTFLSKKIGLKESYPFQQPILLDLAAFACWGDSPQTKSRAVLALAPVMTSNRYQDICSNLRPNSWIYLVIDGNNSGQEVEAPLRRINGTESKLASKILLDWIRILASDPVEYIQIKAIFATQVLFVGNTFLFINSQLSEFISDKKILMLLSTPVLFLVLIIGNIYLFSYFLLICILVSLLTSNKIDTVLRKNLKFLFGITIMSILILSISYVSDEARYVFSFVYLLYLMIIREINYFRVRKVYGYNNGNSTNL